MKAELVTARGGQVRVVLSGFDQREEKYFEGCARLELAEGTWKKRPGGEEDAQQLTSMAFVPAGKAPAP
jgi:hypothetical protein